MPRKYGWESLLFSVMLARHQVVSIELFKFSLLARLKVVIFNFNLNYFSYLCIFYNKLVCVPLYPKTLFQQDIHKTGNKYFLSWVFLFLLLILTTFLKQLLSICLLSKRLKLVHFTSFPFKVRFPICTHQAVSLHINRAE